MTAERYARDGWSPIPLIAGCKEPIKGIKVDKYKFDANHFVGTNVGVRMGVASGGLVDIDADWPEAREIFLGLMKLANISTARFGRASASGSHHLFVVRDLPKTSVNFSLPAKTTLSNLPEEHGHMVIQYRCTGHTMMPPSQHPCGEEVTWEVEHPPLVIEHERLLRFTSLTAFLAVCRRYAPSEGIRQDFAGAFAGTMRRAGWEVEDAIAMHALVTGFDEERKSRERFIRDTFASSKENQTGLPRLCELLGLPFDVRTRLSEWLGSQASEQIDEINATYFGATERNQSRVYRIQHDPILKRDHFVCLTVPDFEAELNLWNIGPKGRKESVARKWWESKYRLYYRNGFVFDPSGRTYPDTYNLWRGFAVEPAQGDWSLMREHIRYAAQELFDYALRWMAWTVQHPDKLPESALVFRGSKGSGKGTIAKWLLEIFGHHSLHLTNSHLLTGRFNGHMRDCCFVFADEAFWAGDKAGEGELKALITEAGKTFEQKGRDAVAGVNYVHLMIASNENWVVPATKDERRFAVCDVPSERARDASYFGPIYQQARNGGVAAMLYDLQRLDLGDWHPRSSIPETSALRDQVEASEPPERVLLRRILELGALPGTVEGSLTELDVVTAPALKEALRHVAFGSKVTDKALGSLMREIAVDHDNNGRQLVQLKDAGATQAPEYRRCYRYIMPSLAEARRRFDANAAWPDEPSQWQAERYTDESNATASDEFDVVR